MLTKNYPEGNFWLTGMLPCEPLHGTKMFQAMFQFSYYKTPIWHGEHLKESFSSLRSSKKHPYFNEAVNIMEWLIVLQSFSMAERTRGLCCRGGRRGGTVSHWWIICLLISEWHSGVWIKGLLSCFSIRWGCREVITQRRAAVWASCPVELSLCSGLATHQSASSFLPEAWAEAISLDLWFLDI